MAKSDIKIKEYIKTTKWQRILKNNVIDIKGDDILFDLKDNNSELIISKNKEGGFFTLNRSWDKYLLENHNGITDDAENSGINLNDKELYEFRIWFIPLNYFKEIFEVFETVLLNKLQTYNLKRYELNALYNNFKENDIFKFLMELFDYDTLKILLGEFDTSIYVVKLKKMLNHYFNNLDFKDVYVSYYQKQQKTLINQLINDPAYKEIETFNIDSNGNVDYNYSGEHVKFTDKVIKFMDFVINNNNISNYLELEKEVIDNFNNINAIRDEMYKHIKERDKNDNQNK